MADRPSPHTFAGADAADLKLAARELEAGQKLLAAAYAITERRERAAAIAVAIGRLALASRFVDEVVCRRTAKEPAA